MDFNSRAHTIWFQNWLNEYSENEYHENERKDETFLVDFSNYTSLSEVSLEIYNCIRSSDLSLDQLNSYINKLGVIISQSDLRAISTQPRSKMAKMFSVIFEAGDISTILLECINKNSYAYVYLMIRVLFEIVLYTKSTPVRSFAHAQIMKNKNIIKSLMAISYNPSNPELSSEPYVIDKHTNPMGGIGFPNSSYSQNVFESLLLDMLQTPDMNVCCMGIQLLSVVPTVASKSPQILNELYLFLIADDDELSYMASVSLSLILPLLPELVSLNFIKACYSNALKNYHNVQRVKSFTLLTLSCKSFKNIPTYAYRMIWSLHLELDKQNKLDDHPYSIFTECKIALLLASTLISVEQKHNVKRQEERLRSLLQGYLSLLKVSTKPESTNFETNRTNLLLVRGIIYSLFLMYASEEANKEVTNKLSDLVSIMTNNTLNPNKYVNINNVTDGIDPLLDKKNDFFALIYYGACVKLLELFAKTSLMSTFGKFMELFNQSLRFSSENINILIAVKKSLKHFQQPCAVLLKMVVTVAPHIDEVEESFRQKMLLALLEMIEYAFLVDLGNFGNLVARYNEKVASKSLKLIMRPLLQIQNINYVSMLTEQEILVHHLYSCVNNEVLSEKYQTRPLVVDFGKNKIYAGEGNLTVTVVRRKSSWGSEYSKIIRRQIESNFINNDQKIEQCDLYSNLYKVGVLCLRLGFYTEASVIFGRLSFVLEKCYFWMRILFKFASSQAVEPSHLANRSDLEQYFGRYIGLVRNVLGLFKVFRTTNSLRSSSHAQRCWDYELNYELPVPILYSFITLNLCLKLGVGDLITSIKDKKYNFERFIRLFTSLKAAFKALAFVFRYKSKETVCVLSGYQGIVTVIVKILRNIDSKKVKGNIQVSSHGEKVDLDYFWTYLCEFDRSLDKPDVLYIMDLFPKRKRNCLLTNLFMTQKNTAKTKVDQESNVVSNAKINLMMDNKTLDMKYAPEAVEIALDTIWFEVAGSLRLLARNAELFCYQSDVPSFNKIYKTLQPLSKDFSDHKVIAFLESVLFAEIQTPVGITKAYALPYVSLTATLLMQKRGELEIQTVLIQGHLQNYKGYKEISHVSLRMEFNELEGEKVFRYRLKMEKSTVYETVLIKVPQEVCKNGIFVAVPVDGKHMPIGVPCTVPLTQKFV
ncbi:hypothetical protein MACJ_001401 [Theileria orientalis]|uniref:Integrator complex subunit 7 n=1 Tax=Theileria orientalis TaxID=68886 RepID=A0A976MAT9_THEOR|nr:hypothetical protein MACJ_001401 [Theileria orientalis]